MGPISFLRPHTNISTRQLLDRETNLTVKWGRKRLWLWTWNFLGPYRLQIVTTPAKLNSSLKRPWSFFSNQYVRVCSKLSFNIENKGIKNCIIVLHQQRTFCWPWKENNT